MSDLVAGDVRNADELGQYRSLSSLAVLALVLGIGAPLILASPQWSILPVAGIAIAILALVKIHAAAGSLTGTWLAKAGLALSVFSLVLPFSKEYVRDSIDFDDAKAVAEQWLSNICDDKGEAAARMVLPRTLFEMTARPTPPGSKAPEYKVEDGIAKFQNNDDVQVIAQEESLKSFTLEPAKTTLLRQSDHPEILLYYGFGGNSRQSASFCKILLVRRATDHGSDLWFIKDWHIESQDHS